MRKRKIKNKELDDILEVLKDSNISSERIESIYNNYFKDDLVSREKIEKVIAKHLNIPIKILKDLSLRLDTYLDSIVVCNKSVYSDLDFVKYLSKSSNVFVREVVASRTSSDELIDKLSRDKEYVVRLAVANNGNTSLDILKKLKNDSNSIVSSTASEILYGNLK